MDEGRLVRRGGGEEALALEAAQVVADGADLPQEPGLAAGVVQEPGVVLLRAEGTLPPTFEMCRRP